ncbi:MAG TPA: YjbQ family protein [bacterium]|nr:YjbQ family protein [bacterium]HEX68080.1 YjbQ family protein [bacterium]
MQKITIRTRARQELVDITGEIEEVIRKTGFKNGLVNIFTPHTTAAVIVNENYDPSVARDILNTLEKIVPSSGTYTHLEGNAHAHIKSSIIGSSRLIPVQDGKLQLGTWQGVFFCEFDGPRTRQVWISFLKEE